VLSIQNSFWGREKKAQRCPSTAKKKGGGGFSCGQKGGEEGRGGEGIRLNQKRKGTQNSSNWESCLNWEGREKVRDSTNHSEGRGRTCDSQCSRRNGAMSSSFLERKGKKKKKRKGILPIKQEEKCPLPCLSVGGKTTPGIIGKIKKEAAISRARRGKKKGFSITGLPAGTREGGIGRSNSLEYKKRGRKETET